MTDFKQIKEWIDTKQIIIIANNNSTQKNSFISNIINTIIKEFIEHLKLAGIDLELEPYTHTKDKKGSWCDLYESYIKQLKKYQYFLENQEFQLQHKEIFEFFFGGEHRNIFTYMNQIIYRKQSTPNKIHQLNTGSFIKLCYIKCINAMRKIYFSPEIFSSITNENEATKNFDTFEDLAVIRLFEPYKLNYLLETYDNDNTSIGQKIFNAFPNKKPLFLDNTIIENNKLVKHIFIEGFHLSGKTTLAHQIGDFIGNSYYIDLSNRDKTIIVDNDRKKIRIFLHHVLEMNGTVILDNTNHNPISKTHAQIYLEYADIIGVKLIFISLLEQSNNMRNVKSFIHSEVPKWNSFREEHCYLEISPIKGLSKTRIGILQNFLLNYLTYKKLDHLIDFNFDQDLDLLHYLDKVFGGMLHLLKIAIDNNKDIDRLYDLNDLHASFIITNSYKPLLDQLHMHPFIELSKNDSYLRVNQDHYHKVFSIQNSFIIDLIDDKKLYLIEDEKLNQNYVLYFPNKIIPSILHNYLEDRFPKKVGVYKSNKAMKFLHNLSINNTMNLFRNIRHLQEKKYFFHLSKIVFKNKYFSATSQQKVSLHDMSMFLTSFLKDETEMMDNSLPQRKDFIIKLHKVITENKEYLYYLLLNTPAKVSLSWLYALKKYIAIFLRHLNSHSIQVNKKLKDYIALLKDLQKVTISSIINIFENNQIKAINIKYYDDLLSFLDYLNDINTDTQWNNEIFKVEQFALAIIENLESKKRMSVLISV